jgi:N-acetyl-alpha-D-muramate 1-phosphate uridylyltransferase
MKANMVILAGGLGTRLKPHTDNTPKSMVLVNDKPFLQYQLELLKKNNITEVVIIVGHLWEQITNFIEDGSKFGLNIKCVYNHSSDALPCLYRIQHLLDNHFMVMYGDSYLDFNYNLLYNYHLSRQLMSDSITFITMTIYKNPNLYQNNVIRYFADVKKIYYSKAGFEGAVYIDYGVSVIAKEVLNNFSGPIFANNLTLAQFYQVVSANFAMNGFIVSNRFYEIGTPESLEEFKRFIDDSH